jgi:hypothetical protein
LAVHFDQLRREIGTNFFKHDFAPLDEKYQSCDRIPRQSIRVSASVIRYSTRKLECFHNAAARLGLDGEDYRLIVIGGNFVRLLDFSRRVVSRLQ